MRKFLIASCLLGATGAVVFWLLTMPRPKCTYHAEFTFPKSVTNELADQ